MPRRKKASGSTNRPSLTFVPSPDLQPPPLLTPEMAVQNPITAKAVQLDELASTTWVSPQFYLNPGKKKKTRKHSYSRKDTQSIHKSKCFNETGHLQKKSSRYKQLQFINDIETGYDQSLCDNHKTDSVKATKIVAVEKRTHVMCEPDTLQINTPELVVTDLQLRDVYVTEKHCCPADETSDNFPSFFTLIKPRTLFTSQTDIPLNTLEMHPGDKDHDLEGEEHFKEKENISFNNCATPLRSLKKSKVLVPDTPEADYGLSLRLRQIKYGIMDNIGCVLK